MWAVTVSIKFQNKLAKEAIIKALKNKRGVFWLMGISMKFLFPLWEDKIIVGICNTW